MLDMLVAGVIATVVIMLISPDYLLDPDSGYGITWLAFLFWIPCEAVLLSAFSTTPGKSLLRTRVMIAGGAKPSLGKALARAVRVWFFGMGTGFPLVSVFTMAYQHGKLKKNGEVSWDRKLNTRVEHSPLSTARVAFAVVLLVGAIGLSLIPG